MTVLTWLDREQLGHAGSGSPVTRTSGPFEARRA